MSVFSKLRINPQRLMDRIHLLGEQGALEGGGVSRLALSDADKAGRDLVVGWMHDLDLEVRIDKIGNVVGVRAGTESAPPVMTGSHIDTVSTGGLYDGNLGVLAGLEVMQTLNDYGVTTRLPLAVAFFTNEEGARFAPDMMGSLVFRGGMTLEDALATMGIDGATLAEELQRIGYDGDAPVGEAANPVSAFVELHIEQGPVLDSEGITIGAVTGVQGISWTEFEFKGISNHAGTTPMLYRHDAGLVAAELACYARKIAQQLGGDQLANVGHWTIRPNLVNVIPNYAKITVDLRNTDELKLQEAEAMLHQFAAELCHREGVSFKHRSLARFEPVQFDPGMIDRVEQVATELGCSVKRFSSGAGHDAQILAEICPTSMIFVPSVKGISHNIKEHTEAPDIEMGANTLLLTLIDLAS